jgi:hypothetical protein
MEPNMDLQATKLDVMQKIMHVSSPSLLKRIDDLLEDELIVGFSASGEELTKRAYNERLEMAEKQLEEGKYVTQEQLEKESADW